MTASNGSLLLDTPWAIGEKSYEQILEALSGKRVERIVEFGSGISTVRLAQDFPETRILSIEHHKKFYEQTMELLHEHQVRNAHVLHCPLKWGRIGIRAYLTYDLNVGQLERGIDFALIDGPVEAETLRGREAPLYIIFPLLKIGALVALDDYHRDSAKAVVRNWLNSYQENLMVIKESERLILLQKCGEQHQPTFPGSCSLLDNILVNIRLILLSLKKLARLVVLRT